MPKLIVVGAGGCGRDVMHWAYQASLAGAPWEVSGFLDDNPVALEGLKTTHPLLGSIAAWQPREGELFLCAIADPSVRSRLVASLLAKGACFTTLVHPTATVVATASIGTGSIISPFCVISDNARVGEHVFINVHSAIGHDASVGDYATICSYCDVTGGVQLGEKVYLGSHVTVVPQMKVGAEAFLCAGSVVVNHIASGARVMGNPAKRFTI
ncbi:MAG: NeuD/PglB/VioB family sugar acetyltransferase [Symbiobacteriaceae bacterium]|nr:NeuD/PglB/VioB family sugar acetyltransferase [Symbiobacteriaceae bacterium]